MPTVQVHIGRVHALMGSTYVRVIGDLDPVRFPMCKQRHVVCGSGMGESEEEALNTGRGKR